MAKGNPLDRGVASDDGIWSLALACALWALALGLLFVAQRALGPAPEGSGLLAASGGVPTWVSAPRALAVHGSWVHLAFNVVTAAVVASLWVALGRIDPLGRGLADRALTALGLAVVSGAASLALAAALDGGARVGASGGLHGLLGALVAGLWLRARAAEGDDRRRRRALGAGALMALALPLFMWLGLHLGSGGRGVDHVSHGLGLVLGLLLGPVAEHPRASRALGAVAAGWCVLATIA